MSSEPDWADELHKEQKLNWDILIMQKSFCKLSPEFIKSELADRLLQIAPLQLKPVKAISQRFWLTTMKHTHFARQA